MSDTLPHHLGQAFARIAARHAERPAIRPLSGEPITYRDMLAAAESWAGWLHAAGVRRHDVVALLHDKSPSAYGAMLGALLIGAPYVGIDPANPPERLVRIAGTCRPVLVLAPTSDRAAAIAVAAASGARVALIDDPTVLAEVAASSAIGSAVREAVHRDDPAYLMFTSGSTGTPKGATMSHGNVLNFIDWTRTEFATTPDDVFTGLNPVYFDNSVFDVYASLFTGASLVPVPTGELKHPRKLVERVAAAGCTVWFSVPSLIVYALNLKALGRDDLPRLRAMSFGGEGFPKGRLRALWDLLGHRVRLVNVYGPTECTCICSALTVTSERLDGDALLPLGLMARNFDARVLDEHGHALAPGSTGELGLVGPNVGLGYWRDPERTAKAFVQDPANDRHPARLYRTGDLVRHDAATGWFHFLGRTDHQIKHLGYRIELEEIEQVVGGLACVGENACVYQRNPGEEFGRIVLFVAIDGAITDEALLAELRRILPAYMVPGLVRRLDHLPKNANGKIDRRALLASLDAQGAPA